MTDFWLLISFLIFILISYRYIISAFKMLADSHINAIKQKFDDIDLLRTDLIKQLSDARQDYDDIVKRCNNMLGEVQGVVNETKRDTANTKLQIQKSIDNIIEISIQKDIDRLIEQVIAKVITYVRLEYNPDEVLEIIKMIPQQSHSSHIGQ